MYAGTTAAAREEGVRVRVRARVYTASASGAPEGPPAPLRTHRLLPWFSRGDSLRVGLTPAAKRGTSGDWRLGGGRAGSPSGSRSGARSSAGGGVTR